MQRQGPVVGGIGVTVDGDCANLNPPGDAPQPCDATILLHTRETDEPLRPSRAPAHEVDSWTAFCDGETLQLCVRAPARHDPAIRDIMRIELGLTSLEGLLWHRRGDGHLPLFAYPANQLLLIHALGLVGGLMAHAASIAGRDGAYLLPGPSGAGKTTMSIAAHDVGARVLSDERTVVKPTRDGWVAGGTPWPGEGGYAENVTLPLKGIMFLEQAERDELVPVTPARALANLYRCHLPPVWDARSSQQTLDNLERLVREVPVFLLRNRRGRDAARMLLDRLGGPA